MTITAVFESFEDMMGFAGNLVGNGGQEASRTFLSGGDVYRKSESSPQDMQEEPPKDEEQPGDRHEAATEPVKGPEDGAQGYTLVQVRERLAELQKAGKRAQVQGLISGFGVKKLTEVPEGRYAELMQKAGEL